MMNNFSASIYSEDGSIFDSLESDKIGEVIDFVWDKLQQGYSAVVKNLGVSPAEEIELGPEYADDEDRFEEDMLRFSRIGQGGEDWDWDEQYTDSYYESLDDDDDYDDDDWYEDEDKYSLVGVDGNAYSIMGYTANALKREGLRDLVDQMHAEATSGDYDNLISVCFKYVEMANEAARGDYDDIQESLNEDASMEKVYTVNYPSAGGMYRGGWVSLSDQLDKNGEGKKIHFKNQEELDEITQKLVSQGYINWQGFPSARNTKQESLKNTKINIRESLNKIDLRTSNKYDLRNLYDSCILTDKEKRTIAEMIARNTKANVLYEALMNKFEGKELKESDDQSEKTVIYKELGKFRATPESNYNSRIRKERKVQKLDDFDSADDIMNYYIKYGWADSKDDFKVIDESLKESKDNLFKHLIYNIEFEIKHGGKPEEVVKEWCEKAGIAEDGKVGKYLHNRFVLGGNGFDESLEEGKPLKEAGKKRTQFHYDDEVIIKPSKSTLAGLSDKEKKECMSFSGKTGTITRIVWNPGYGRYEKGYYLYTVKTDDGRQIDLGYADIKKVDKKNESLKEAYHPGTYKVRVYNIDYEIDPEDAEYELGIDDEDPEYEQKINDWISSVENELPNELVLSVDAQYGEDDLEDEIADAISDETGWLVANFNYEILERPQIEIPQGFEEFDGYATEVKVGSEVITYDGEHFYVTDYSDSDRDLWVSRNRSDISKNLGRSLDSDEVQFVSSYYGESLNEKGINESIEDSLKDQCEVILKQMRRKMKSISGAIGNFQKKYDELMGSHAEDEDYSRLVNDLTKFKLGMDKVELGRKDENS